jgi:hypothetical protein
MLLTEPIEPCLIAFYSLSFILAAIFSASFILNFYPRSPILNTYYIDELSDTLSISSPSIDSFDFLPSKLSLIVFKIYFFLMSYTFSTLGLN